MQVSAGWGRQSMHRTENHAQVRGSDTTRQDKVKLVGEASRQEGQQQEYRGVKAGYLWRGPARGATTVSVAERSPLGCQALWRGKASVNKQGRS